MERTVVYIDGFNLYFGLKSKNWNRYYWLDLELLSKNLLKFNQSLEAVNYFTAKVSTPEDKKKRQLTYIEALKNHCNIKITYGKYQANTIECYNCGNKINKPNEKMTDVNIATALLCDAFEDKYDTAILVTADSDLKGPISYITENFKGKRIICAFPPNRKSFELKNVVHATFTIGRKKFKDSMLPEEVKKPDGYILKKPRSWK